MRAAAARLADRGTYSPEDSHSPSACVGLARSRSRCPWGLFWETCLTLAAGGSVVSFLRGKQCTKTSLVTSRTSCCCPGPVEKKRTASDRCQTNLPLLTCAANVEPSDPDLDGNHCKYFPARPVEEAFSRASHWGI